MELLPEIMRAEFYKKTTDRHIAAQLPEEARRYLPPADEIIEINKNPAKSVRKIFEYNKFTTFEREKLDKLRDEILLSNKKTTLKKKFEILDDDYRDSYLLRLLYSESFNISAAVQSLKEFVKIEAEYKIKSINVDVMEILNSGFIYIHGRDCKYRPILVINSKILQARKFNLKDIFSSIIYLLDYCIQDLLIPSSIENWNILLNLIESKLLKEIKEIVNFICKYYRSRLCRLYIINYTKKLSIDRINPNKIISVIKRDDIFTDINQSQVEEQFGGTAVNIKTYFYPPIFPSNKYLNNTNDKIYLVKKVTEDFNIELNKNFTNISNGMHSSDIQRNTSRENILRNCEISLNKRKYHFKPNHSFREYEIIEQHDLSADNNNSFAGEDKLNDDLNNSEANFRKPTFYRKSTKMVTRKNIPVIDVFNSNRFI
jgi:hypothetical protein